MSDPRPRFPVGWFMVAAASDLREASWGYLQSAVSTVKPAQYYLDYGAKHLTRFLIGARQAGLAPKDA